MTYPGHMVPYGLNEGARSSGKDQQYAPYGLQSPVEQSNPGREAGPSFRHPEAGHRQGPSARKSGRPLRAVHVGPCFARGGAEQQIIDLARFFDPERVRIEKCICTNSALIDPAVVADMPAAVEVGGAEAVRRAAQEHDLMIFWGLPMDDWLADCPPKLCVFLAHGEGPWTRDMLEESAGVVDHVIAVSRRVRERVCNGQPTSVILNGIDSARLGQTRSRDDARASLGFAPGDFVLGYVGRLSPEKRPELVIRAAARLPRHFKTLLVGWGPQRNELIDMANAMIPGRFAFVMADHHLGDYYQSLDALCLLSEYEGFALVVLEAMMCGRPVIVTPVGSVPEVVVDRVNGIIVDDDPTSLCQAAQLLDRHPHWARGIADEGRAFAQQHGHAWRMAREYEQLLERLWAEKQGSLLSA